MKSRKRIASILAMLMLVCVTCYMAPVWADDYEYTVTVSGGVQGTAAKSVKVAYGGTVTISPDDVTINNDKYYLKGFHVSGQQTPVVQAGDITGIKEDMHLVATYGIKQSMVRYTVKYVDENEDELIDAKTFYGNVGDKPVLAFTRIEGYKPDAYALTKTLSENEDENQFVFSYSETESESPEPDEDDSDDDDNDNGGSDDEGSDEDADDESSDADGGGADGNGTATAAGAVGNAAGAGTNIFQGGADGNDGGDGTGAADENDDSGVVDLDDQEVAKTDGSDSENAGNGAGGPNAALIAGGAAAALILAVLIALFMKRRKSDEQ